MNLKPSVGLSHFGTMSFLAFRDKGEELTRELPDRVTLVQAVGDTEVWLAVGVDVSPEMVGSS